RAAALNESSPSPSRLQKGEATYGVCTFIYLTSLRVFNTDLSHKTRIRDCVCASFVVKEHTHGAQGFGFRARTEDRERAGHSFPRARRILWFLKYPKN